MNRALANEITWIGGVQQMRCGSGWQRVGRTAPTSLGVKPAEPAGYIGINHLQEIVDELVLSVESFRDRAVPVVNFAFRSELPELTRRAIQVAAVVVAAMSCSGFNSLRLTKMRL